MKNNEQSRAEISAIIDDIARIQADPRVCVHEVGDREAYAIVCRIEARIRAANLKLP